MTLQMVKQFTNDVCCEGKGKDVGIYLFSSRELQHVALRHICEADSGFALLGIENRLSASLETLAIIKPDLVIVDMDLLPEDHVALETALCSLRGCMRVILLADRMNIACARTVIASGVHGYILTSVSIEEFRQALRVVIAGGLWLGQDLARSDTHQFVETRPDDAVQMARLLSQREQEILNRVAQGATSKEIAKKLFLSESSVRTYWYRVLSKLNALNKAEAIARAARLGLLDTDTGDEDLVLPATKARLRAMQRQGKSTYTTLQKRVANE